MHLLGDGVIHTGFLGREEEELYRRRLDGIPCFFHAVDGRTRTDTTIIDPIAQTETHIREPGFNVTEEQVEAFLADLASRVSSGDLVTLSGSLPPGAPLDTYARIIRLCAERGVESFLDTSGDALHEGIAATPTLMKPNDEELAELTGKRTHDDSEIVPAARDLLERGVSAVAVSLGARGAVLVDREGAWRGEAEAPTVVNTVAVVATHSHVVGSRPDEKGTLRTFNCRKPWRRGRKRHDQRRRHHRSGPHRTHARARNRAPVVGDRQAAWQGSSPSPRTSGRATDTSAP